MDKVCPFLQVLGVPRRDVLLKVRLGRGAVSSRG